MAAPASATPDPAPADPSPAAADAVAAPAAPARRKPLLRHPFRRKTFRPRTLSLYLAGALALVAARPTAACFFPGLALVAAGAALRLWATGYLLKTDELTTAGPYAFLRHPLYAGALAIGVGFALMAGPPVAAIVVPLGVLFFFAYYLPYKDGVESQRLEALYGDDFRRYRVAVAALVPRLRPWRAGATTGRASWRLDRVLENDEQTALAYMLAAILLLAVIWSRQIV